LRCFRHPLAAVLMAVLLVGGLAMPAAHAANVTLRMAAVTEVVAGILSYARWPDSGKATAGGLQLCVVGPTEYADALLQSGNPASRWRDDVKRLAVDDYEITAGCHALYVGVIDDQESQQLFSRIQGSHILSISERNDSCAMGSMFCLNIEDGLVTFDVNLDAVARSGVKVHPHVLKLGRRTSRP